MPLVQTLWREVLSSPTSQENKTISLCGILQSYCALVGMTDDDFKDLLYQLPSYYPGPLPDGYSEEIMKRYKENKSDE